ncbi:MAG: archease [candidate division Zixibacteria bacterium]|nr:archease [candidate division Zixibacteria bacterium]
MVFRFNYLPDIALADAALEVWADSWGELLAGATAAMTALMVVPEDLKPLKQQTVEVRAESVGQLLYDWLSELIFLKDTVGLLVVSAQVEVVAGESWCAASRLQGDTIDPARHRLGRDVKAVTYHRFEVTQRGSEFYAKIVLDI